MNEWITKKVLVTSREAVACALYSRVPRTWEKREEGGLEHGGVHWLNLGASTDLPILGLGGEAPRDRIPDQENLGGGPPTTREISLRMKCFKDFPGNLGEDGLQEDQEVLVEGT